ncbi:hypothetical protein [Tepidibacillus sp. HK-1]|uniref:hypothetical protein n=2 Tax=Tepidibacillus TaxID=1494427 RepID=UPI0015EBA1E6|nr:hypothetical protein [Tepidibacillus sp. HK-1]
MKKRRNLQGGLYLCSRVEGNKGYIVREKAYERRNNMVLNKGFMVIMAIFVLGVVLLTGCVDSTGGETELEREAGVTDFSASANEEKAVAGEEDAPVDEEEVGESQAIATTSGTLKAINAVDGTVTIATESDNELVLKITSGSKIFVSESLPPLTQLDTVIGSKVSAEYHAETKTVMVIYIQD